MSGGYYDRRWRRVRRRFLAKHPFCERCKVKPAEDVHHRDGLGLTEPRAYDPTNFEALCHSCHSLVTTRACQSAAGSPRLTPDS